VGVGGVRLSSNIFWWVRAPMFLLIAVRRLRALQTSSRLHLTDERQQIRSKPPKKAGTYAYESLHVKSRKKKGRSGESA